MKVIHLNCDIQCLPLNGGEVPEGAEVVEDGGGRPGTFDPHAKQFVFSDQDTGEVIHFKMAGVLVKSLKSQLAMNNKNHIEKIRSDADSARARSVIAGAANATPEQIAQLAAQKRAAGNGQG